MLQLPPSLFIHISILLSFFNPLRTQSSSSYLNAFLTPPPWKPTASTARKAPSFLQPQPVISIMEWSFTNLGNGYAFVLAFLERLALATVVCFLVCSSETELLCTAVSRPFTDWRQRQLPGFAESRWKQSQVPLRQIQRHKLRLSGIH